MLNEHRPSHLN
jgi:hypothetical protein